MQFPDVPSVSHSQVDKAGKVLKTARRGDHEYKEAIKIVNAWRVCHAYPINTFVSTLRKKTAKYPGTIVAQRLKRLPTIIFKLQRFKNMQLSSMQDIGGVRAVLDTVSEVRKLQNEYADPKRFSHKLKSFDDYINSPKPDGYRGVHMIYEYDNTLDRTGKAQQYKGLKVELQIRTKLQHQWATAVETVGTMRSEALKSMQGHPEWRELFEYISSAFAIAEDAPVLEKHQDMTPQEIFKSITELEARLNAIETISGWRTVVNIVQNNKKDLTGHFMLIVLDTNAHTVSIRGYAEQDLMAASQKYAELENEYADNPSKDVVMVALGKIKSLKQAYPNYFLDTEEFIRKVQAIVNTVKRESV